MKSFSMMKSSPWSHSTTSASSNISLSSSTTKPSQHHQQLSFAEKIIKMAQSRGWWVVVLSVVFILCILFFFVYSTVLYIEHRWHREKMIKLYGHSYLGRRQKSKPGSDMFHDDANSNNNNNNNGAAAADDEYRQDFAHRHAEIFDFKKSNTENHVDSSSSVTTTIPESEYLSDAKRLLRNRRQRMHVLRLIILDQEKKRKRQEAKVSSHRDETASLNNDNHSSFDSNDEGPFTNEQLDKLIDYNNLLDPVKSDRMRIHNATQLQMTNDRLFSEQEEFLSKSLFEHPQTHEKFNLSAFAPALGPDVEEPLFKRLNDEEVAVLRKMDQRDTEDEEHQRRQSLAISRLEATMDFPEKPLPIENAAELRRLRIIRERIESRQLTFHAQLSKPVTRYQGASQYRGRRRPLQELPKLKCSPREKVDTLPTYTRHDKNKRPDIAIVSLVAKSKKHHADNTARREQMHEYTFMNKLQYCKKFGYDLIIEDESAVDKSRPPHWSKIRVLRKWLPLYKWVVWMDQDVLITNWDVKIEAIVQDEMTRELLKNLRQQENDAQILRDREVIKKLGRTEDGERLRVMRLRKRLEIDRARDELKREVLQQEYDDLFGNFDFNRSSDAAAVSQMPSFKMRQYDLLITHDLLSGINSGVMFFRNTKWSQNILRRMWGTPPALTKPFFDQGSLRWLIDVTGFRGRDREEASIDRNHVLDFDDNFFNSYPQNFIHRERDIGDEWTPGDFAVHGASCKFYPFCMDWIKYFYELAQCNNAHSFDPPYFMFDVRQKLIKQKNEAMQNERTKEFREKQEKTARIRAARELERDQENKKRWNMNPVHQTNHRGGDDDNVKLVPPPNLARLQPQSAANRHLIDENARAAQQQQQQQEQEQQQQQQKEAAIIINSTHLLLLHKEVDEIMESSYKSFAPSSFLPPPDETSTTAERPTLPPLDEPLWDVSRQTYPKNFVHQYFPKDFNVDPLLNNKEARKRHEQQAAAAGRDAPTVIHARFHEHGIRTFQRDLQKKQQLGEIVNHDSGGGGGGGGIGEEHGTNHNMDVGVANEDYHQDDREERDKDAKEVKELERDLIRQLAEVENNRAKQTQRTSRDNEIKRK